MAYYRQPEFFRDFHCMGGSCPDTCCALWNIDWKESEVEKLKNADCSPELKELIERSFVRREDNEKLMKIVTLADKKHDCPFLDEQRYCRIQRELGEEYLSDTCRNYPRLLTISGDIVTRTCSASCPQVIRLLCENEKAMQLVNVGGKGDTHGFIDTPKELKANPELKYRSELTDFFFDIIGNTKRSLETSLLLGALAAQKLTEYVDKGQCDRIPEVIKALRPQLNKDSIPSFENSKQDYELNPGFLAEMSDSFTHTDVFRPLMDNDILLLDRYSEGREIVDRYFAEKPHIMRNIALNMFLEGKMPFMVTGRSIFHNYSLFVSTVCSLKLVSISLAYKNKKFSDGIYDIWVYFIRGMYHQRNSDNDARIQMLIDKGCNTPAFLAKLLK